MDGASIADTPQWCHLALRSDGRLLITRMWARRIGNSAVLLMCALLQTLFCQKMQYKMTAGLNEKIQTCIYYS